MTPSVEPVWVHAQQTIDIILAMIIALHPFCVCLPSEEEGRFSQLQHVSHSFLCLNGICLIASFQLICRYLLTWKPRACPLLGFQTLIDFLAEVSLLIFIFFQLFPILPQTRAMHASVIMFLL